MHPLTITQIEDVFVFIGNHAVKHNLVYETLSDYFASGTDSFVDFILAVEKHFAWFDYTQSKYVIEILEIFIQKAHDEMYSEA